MQAMAETNTTTFGNITNLIELLRNAKLPEILTKLNGLSSSTPSGSTAIPTITPPKANVTVRQENSRKQVVIWHKPPSYTKGELQPMVIGEHVLEPKARMEKELMEIAAQEAKLNALNKHELIKREHLAKLKKSNEIKKKRYNQYVWTTSSRLKPEKITDIHIYPNTKPVAITIYMNNDQRNFDVHEPFRLGDFGVTKWDEFGAIIPKKKNKVVEELITSLIKKQKEKVLELEPEVHVAGIECDRSLLEGIQFVKNKVIETPEHGIFFIDVFGDQALQRINDIHKSFNELPSSAQPESMRMTQPSSEGTLSE
nr:hypothetical protein [Tanacetum cinerariifolium]